MQRRNLLAGLAAGIAAAASVEAAHTATSTERPVRRTDYLLSEEEAWYVIANTPNAVMGTADAQAFRMPYRLRRFF